MKDFNSIFKKEKQTLYKECGSLYIDAKWNEFKEYVDNVIDKYYNFIDNVLEKIKDDNKKLKMFRKTINNKIVKTEKIGESATLISYFDDIEELNEFSSKYKQLIMDVENFKKNNENLLYTESQDSVNLIDGFIEDDYYMNIESVEIVKEFFAQVLVKKDELIKDEKAMIEIYKQILLNLLNGKEEKSNSLRLKDIEYNYITYSDLKFERILNINYFYSIDCKYIDLYKKGELNLKIMSSLINNKC